MAFISKLTSKLKLKKKHMGYTKMQEDEEASGDEDLSNTQAADVFGEFGVKSSPLLDEAFISLAERKDDRRPSDDFQVLTEVQPKHRCFDSDQSYEDILKTHNNWPPNSPTKKEKLARAGFVYIGDGENDRVECFHCGLRLRRWTGEDPWLTHAKFSPKCGHVIKHIGEDYVKKVPAAITEDKADTPCNSPSDGDEKGVVKPRLLMDLDPGDEIVSLVSHPMVHHTTGAGPGSMVKKWAVPEEKKTEKSADTHWKRQHMKYNDDILR